jgi:hypothetical protein
VPRPPPMPMPKAAPRPPPAQKAAPPKPAAPPPAAQPEWDPNSTSVDFRTLGELVRQQDVAQSLFETELVPSEAQVEPEPEHVGEARAADLSKWAAQELAKEERAAKAAPRPAVAPKPKRELPPPPIPTPKPQASGAAAWLWPSVAIGAILAAVLALFLLWN